MNFSVNVGHFKVLKSGIVIGVVAQPIEIIIDDLKFEFVFEDIKESEQVAKPELVNDKHLRIVFTNFNNSLGTGNVEPMLIGSYNNQNLYLSYRIYSLGDDIGKTLQYTFLTSQKN